MDATAFVTVHRDYTFARYEAVRSRVALSSPPGRNRKIIALRAQARIELESDASTAAAAATEFPFRKF